MLIPEYSPETTVRVPSDRPPTKASFAFAWKDPMCLPGSR